MFPKKVIHRSLDLKSSTNATTKPESGIPRLKKILWNKAKDAQSKMDPTSQLRETNALQRSHSQSVGLAEGLGGDDISSKAVSHASLRGGDSAVEKHEQGTPLLSAQAPFIPELTHFPLDCEFETSVVSITKSQIEKPHEQEQTKLPGFLRLPAEIRVQIFELVFPTYLVFILRKEGRSQSLFSRVLKQPALVNAKTIRIIMDGRDPEPRKLTGFHPGGYKGKLYHRILGQKASSRDGVNWNTSLSSVLLTCKTFNIEAAPIMFGLCWFHFDEAKKLKAFMKITPRANLASIRKLTIIVDTYGIPKSASNNVWEQKHIQCWSSIFEQVAECMPNLDTIHLTMSMKNMTDRLKRTFRSSKVAGEWMKRAGYMLMLQPLSRLKKLHTLELKVNAKDFETQQYDSLIHFMFFEYWDIARIQRTPNYHRKFRQLVSEHFDAMRGAIVQAMTEVARGKDPQIVFKQVAEATFKYMSFMEDPIETTLNS